MFVIVDTTSVVAYLAGRVVLVHVTTNITDAEEQAKWLCTKQARSYYVYNSKTRLLHVTPAFNYDMTEAVVARVRR